MVAHVVVDSQVLWYPFLALLVPVLVIAALTRYDAARHARAATRHSPGDG